MRWDRHNKEMERTSRRASSDRGQAQARLRAAARRLFPWRQAPRRAISGINEDREALRVGIDGAWEAGEIATSLNALDHLYTLRFAFA
ncbi:MAG: hypothetical protein HY650_10940 [Acidobacteria bacterium]|nr:hypothetical protein [Acidobacteriota bacterium]